MSEDAVFIYRPLNAEDLSFLHHSWATSYYQGSAAYKLISPAEFHSYHRPLRERFFSKPNTTVIVCSPSTNPWQIIGWIAVEVIPSALILHYIYVKSAYKREGIAKQLIKRALPTKPVVFTHLTKHAAQIMSAKQDQTADLKYIPHLV